MFTAIDKSDTKGDKGDKGGLGMNEQAFFEETYHINQSFNPPRWVDAKHFFKYTLCGWLSKT
jgi:hypothetical protein